jgi:dihydrofolate reductase
VTGKVVVNRAMSLDGFVAGPDDSMDWVFEHATPDQVPDVMAATGAMLCGRRTYDIGRRDAGKLSGDAYGGLWNGPIFVLTHRPPPAPPDHQHTFVSGDITAAVATAKAAAGDKDLEVLGSDVTGQCMQAGLIDEIFVLILPVLLGHGTPLVRGAGLGPVNLVLVSSVTTGAVTAMRFQVWSHARADRDGPDRPSASPPQAAVTKGESKWASL